MPSVVVVGAGMAGLTAAELLVRSGWSVTVLKRASGVEGWSVSSTTDQLSNSVEKWITMPIVGYWSWPSIWPRVGRHRGRVHPP